ncbi:hypothetical protein GQ44DRAFT_730904 [Phaeosphaeriaceae sp. PMI808]|nr:hypothetical protein GQ44DRAFT_730904 [Phaeosphaeriaceae sp. PMI808]
MNANNNTKLEKDVFVNHGWIQGLPRKFLKHVLSQAAKPPRTKGKAVGSTTGGESVAQPQTTVKLPPSVPAIAAASTAPVLTIPETAHRPPYSVSRPVSDTSMVRRALEIISEESGNPISDLKDDTLLNDVGIHSLISLMVASKFAEELGITTESGMFMEETTVADIKRFILEATSGDGPEVLADPTAAVAESETMHLSALERHLKVVGSMTVIMAEEIDIAPSAITNQTSLTDLEVDSLLSLMIGSRLRDELDIGIDTSSLLTTLSTVGALREALTAGVGAGEGDTSSLTSTDDGNSTPSSLAKLDHVVLTSTLGSDFESVSIPVPPTASVILQGNPRTATSSLWFFPDGSGLASSYLPLPRIRSDLVVPYSLAGWPASGIDAFHAAQRLCQNASSVTVLWRDYLVAVMGTLPNGSSTISATSNVLSHYVPTPLKVSTLRKINILWACESSADDRFERRPDDPEDMKFLTTKCTDFTPGRWGPLFGDVPVQVDRVENEHHWRILKGDSASRVSQYIAQVLT